VALQLTAPNTREVVDYMNLPAPVRYEELQRESMSAATRSVHTACMHPCTACLGSGANENRPGNLAATWATARLGC
jgi:hypothetical protein